LWLFDFDNTLARLEPVVDWAASRRELEPMLRNAGAPEPLFERFPKGNLVLYEAYRAHLAGMVRRDGGEHRAILERASAIIEKFELAGVDKATPLDGAPELLRSVSKAGNVAGIVTSNSSRTVRRWLEQHSLSDSVRVIVGRDSLLPLKPAPDMILEALKEAKIPASDSAYVGDVAGDCVAAKAAHVVFYGIAGSQGARDALAAAGAVDIFDSLHALAAHRKH
jgi:phosphoglycolate phosphatase-like HAD superfamily hydrolase